jgi:hypothetical protein
MGAAIPLPPLCACLARNGTGFTFYVCVYYIRDYPRLNLNFRSFIFAPPPLPTVTHLSRCGPACYRKMMRGLRLRPSTCQTLAAATSPTCHTFNHKPSHTSYISLCTYIEGIHSDWFIFQKDWPWQLVLQVPLRCSYRLIPAFPLFNGHYITMYYALLNTRYAH